jgi:hypothetical protein
MFHETQIIQLLKKILAVLESIQKAVTPPDVKSFLITKGVINMALLPIAPGFVPGFTATPTPSDSVPSVAPVWISSDVVNAPVTAAANGLTAVVNVPLNAVVGTSFTLTVTYTNADGTVATGVATFTIVAAPSPDITSFTITQTS